MTCPICAGTLALPDASPCVCAPWSRVEHTAPGVTLYCGDSLAVLPALAGRHAIASCVTDPPYGLGAHPDPRELLRCWLEGRPYVPGGTGFMGKDWDAFVPGPEIWREVFGLLPPGGHLIAAFGTRTYDLGSLGVRLADFEIRDLLAWLYGSGFPKSLDVSKAIDKAAGAEREVLGVNPNHRAVSGLGYEGVYAGGNTGSATITAPATDAARQWEGWGTALKPALEPWVLARRPLAGTVARNVQAHGVGGLNVDACRVGWQSEADKASGRPGSFAKAYDGIDGRAFKIADRSHRNPVAEQSGKGRWPANVLHDGSDEVLGVFPETTSGKIEAHHTRSVATTEDVYGAYATPSAVSYGDTGSAARFFYCAKASKRDRDEGNNHPTVKPEALMAHFCTLVTPPGGVVLDPFMGSGSTGKAAVRAGFGFVGIERDPAYFDIAVRRIRAALTDR